MKFINIRNCIVKLREAIETKVYVRKVVESRVEYYNKNGIVLTFRSRPV